MAQPVHTVRKGAIKAAVFEREAQGANGPFKSVSVALQTSFKKGEEWVNKTLTIVKKDLDNAIAALTETRELINNSSSEEEEEIVM